MKSVVTALRSSSEVLLLRGVAAFVILALAQLTCAGQTAGAQQVSAEVSRLQKLLPSLGLSDAEQAQFQDSLRQTNDALRAGYVYLALYRLQPVAAQVGAYEYGHRNLETAKRGKDAFEREWRRLGGELAAKEKQLAATKRAGGTAAAGALAEASLTTVRPEYEAGHLYGLNTTFEDGLYYLGRSSANLDFALFCRALRFDAAGRAPSLRPLDAELKRIEDETLRAYNQPGASAQQPRFNLLNSTLKTASELSGEKMYAGALEKYLEASLILGVIKDSSGEAPTVGSVKAKSEQAHARLTSGAADNSIALIYWERVRFVLDRAAAGATDKEELKRAAVILDEVLPRYFEYVSEVKR